MESCCRGSFRSRRIFGLGMCNVYVTNEKVYEALWREIESALLGRTPMHAVRTKY